MLKLGCMSLSYKDEFLNSYWSFGRRGENAALI